MTKIKVRVIMNKNDEFKLIDPQSDNISSILAAYPNVKDAKELTHLLYEHLERRNQAGDPLEILLYTYNNFAGVGEFKHLVEFFTYYHQILQEWKEIVTLRALCIVHPEKIDAIQQQLKYLKVLNDQDIYLIDPGREAFDEKKATTKRFIFWIDGKKHINFPPVKKLIQSRELLEHFVKRHQATVNISTRLKLNGSTSDFNQDDIFLMCDLKTCYKQCISEYGHQVVFHTNRSNHKPVPQSYRNAYDVYGMGVHKNHVGIKFNTNMLGYTMSGKKPEQLLEEIENQTLFSLLTKSKSAEKYCEENNLYFGYLQTPSDVEYFLMTALAISDKPHVDIITNLGCWTENTHHFLTDPLLGKIKKITLLTSDCKITGETEYKGEDKDGSPGKVVRIIDLRGLSEHDKEILESIAEIDASSGDSSHSAQISGAVGKPKFPFFQSRPWTVCFFVDIIRNLGENFSDCDELKRLFSRFIGMGEGEGIGLWRILGSVPLDHEIIISDKNEFKKFVTQHHKEITEQFHQYCGYLYHHFNVIHEQRHILIRALISSILMKGNDEEQARLLNCMPSWRMNKTNFVFFAAASGNWRLMDTLQKTNSTYFNDLLKEEHTVIGQTPFSFALENLESDKEAFRSVKPYFGFDTNPTIIAFKKIYQALWEGQSGFLKTNYLNGKEQKTDQELENDIKVYIKTNPNSRTAKAWKLANNYSGNCHYKNNALFKEIYQWSFNQKLFSRSQLFGAWHHTLFKKSAVAASFSKNEDIQTKIEYHKNRNSRTAKICNILE